MPPPDLRSIEQIVGPVSRETFGDLQRFTALFLKWNKSINLASAASAEDLWNRHILDSAQLVSFHRDGDRWVDLGTGGGFPGLVLAIILRDRVQMHLVESNRKKAAFLQAAVGELGLGAQVHPRRVEDLEELGRVDIVSARALASLTQLLQLFKPWITSGARGLFLKGRDYRNELKEMSDARDFELIEHGSLTESRSVIIEVRGSRRIE